MTEFLVQRLIRGAQNTEDPAVREAYGRLAGIVGVICNVLLFAGKFLLGTLTGSVAITADAVNNLSDASSSIVTLIGFRLAAKPADEGHPFGHHRIPAEHGAHPDRDAARGRLRQAERGERAGSSGRQRPQARGLYRAAAGPLPHAGRLLNSKAPSW